MTACKQCGAPVEGMPRGAKLCRRCGVLAIGHFAESGIRALGASKGAAVLGSLAAGIAVDFMLRKAAALLPADAPEAADTTARRRSR